MKYNLQGKTFGYLKVKKYKSNSKWECVCICGKKHIVQTGHLNNNSITSCGCKRYSQSDKFIGQRYGRLIILSYYDSIHQGRRYLCKCDCGKEIIVVYKLLKCKNTQSCGCFRKECCYTNHFIDLIGKKFNRLLVLQKVKTKNKRIYWECLCDCGNKVIVAGNCLGRGTKSCGCLQKENSRKLMMRFRKKQKGKTILVGKEE